MGPDYSTIGASGGPGLLDHCHLWQHGPAALCLTLAMGLLLPPRRRRADSISHDCQPAEGPDAEPPSWRVALAGLFAALMVVCRPIDLVFAVTLFLWDLRHHNRPQRWAFTIPAAAVAVALVSYNVWFFDTPSGGYAAIERMHPWAHGVEGTWTGDFLTGAAGTLLSPSHGLFVYCPWIALALVLLPWSWPATLQGDRASLARWLIVALLPTFVLLSKYSCWWGGHSFGPRFWIDAGPIFGIIAAAALSWAGTQQRWLLGAFAAAAAVSVAIQAIGFLCYPSSWHGTPVNADLHHERLWDWRDSELTRCLAEGIRPRSW